jgi:hypothetical protein
MDEQIAQQLGIGALALVAGIAAWILPYKWNPFRLKRLFASILSDEANKVVPKIIGAVLALIGAAILVGTLVVGKFS